MASSGRSAGTVVLAALAIAAGWLSYDNVLTDAAPVTRMAEEAACQVKSCSEKHGLTRMERTPLGQTAEFTWRDGTVSIRCSRAYLVAGERRCVKE